MLRLAVSRSSAAILFVELAEPRVLVWPESTAPTSPESSVAGDPLQHRRRISLSPTPPVASTSAL